MTYCGATLRHAHGIATCELPTGHDGDHRGWCDRCVLDGDDSRLAWHPGETAWPI
jgi:hypothetical protein